MRLFSFQQVHKSSRRNVNLINLNEDCLILIFEDMHIHDLLALAEVHNSLTAAVEHILRRKCAKKTLTFKCPPKHTTKNKDDITEHHNQIDVKNLSLFVQILKRFGHLIPNLDIVHNFIISKEMIAKIYGTINLYSCEALKNLHILSRNDIFTQFNVSFKRVERVSLNGRFVHLSSSKFTFNDIFPSMKCLSFKDVEFHDGIWLNQEYPSLKQITADIWENDFANEFQHFNADALITLIQNNEQIENLALKFATPKLLRMIADELPHLKSLRLDYYLEHKVNNLNATIHFEQLKRLELYATQTALLSNLSFGNLEEFETNLYARETLEFIMNEKNLQRLRLNRNMQNCEILDLATAHLNLTEMHIQCGYHIEVENIVKLLENSENLREMSLYIPWNNESETVFEAMQQISHRWIISMPISMLIVLRRIE